VREIEDDLPKLETVFIVDDGSGTPVPEFERITVRPFNALMSENTADPGTLVDPMDPIAVLMTSGTTGVSKGVLMSHSQFYFFAEEDVQLTRLTKQDVYMTGFPLFHGNAQFLSVYPSLIAGAGLALYPRFSASDWAGRAVRSGATVTNLLGATMSFILAKEEAPHDREHNVRTIYAAPLDSELGRRFTARFGVLEYVDGFGQTEISNVFMTPPGEVRPAGASGVLVDQWYEVRLADPETGLDVPEGNVGELLVRPRAPGIICMEYLGMPEKTVETWRDLWFHTGDGMRRDEQGWYYFVDRVKDALRRRGENISSFEVEAGVRAHPSVQDCAVVGVRADEAGGEDEVMAFVVLKSGVQADPEGIAECCERELPAFMVPRYIAFLDALPLTATEKVRKKELRAIGISEGAWDRLAAARSVQESSVKG
jgi:crotonobetaine/carnitine-CoA ligase